MKRVFLIYDCPLKTCDKLWVYHGLQEAGYDVKVIDCCWKISHIEQRGNIGRVLSRLIVLMQSVQAVLRSTQDDIIVCWQQHAGLYCNRLSGGERKIVSFNWLNPIVKQKTIPLYKQMLENQNCRIVINSQENKEKNLSAYTAVDQGIFYVIPDVYDEKWRFHKPQFKLEGRYCFMGGRANRDWDTFLKVAGMCPDIRFVGVAVASDWKKEWIIPDNVEMHFDVSEMEYYEYMKKAYVAFYPLKEQRVSGLINIIKGGIEGVPVLITQMPATEKYYPEECKDMLFPMGEVDSAREALCHAFDWSVEEYEGKIDAIQEYLRHNYSPEEAATKLLHILDTYEHE